MKVIAADSSCDVRILQMNLPLFAGEARKVI